MSPQRITTQRFGDFFAELKECAWTQPVDGEGLLAALSRVVREGHQDIPADAEVRLKAIVDHDTVVLATDADVASALAAAADSVLVVQYDVGSSAPKASEAVNLIVVLNDLASHKEVPVTFHYSRGVDQQALSALKTLIVAQLELALDASLSISVEVEGDVLALPSDRALQQVLEHAHENPDAPPMRIIVNVVQRSVQQSVPVRAQLVDDTISGHHNAEFPFAFSIDQEGLLASLKEASRHALDIATSAAVELSARIHDATIALPSDKFLLNALTEFLAEGEVLELYVRLATAAAPTLQVNASVTSQRNETVEFVFAFSLEDNNLSQHLRAECGVELECTLTDEDALVYVDANAGEEASISSDTVLRDVLLQLLHDDRRLTLVIRRETKPILLQRPVRCTLNGETASFDFRFSMNQNNILQYLCEEAKGELDLMPNDQIVLSVIFDNDAMILRNDSELREVLSQLEEGQVLELEAREAALARQRSQAVVVLSRPVKCVLEGETAEFRLRFVLQQDGLLDHILSECKEALDLMPNEDIAIAVRMGSEDVGINSDGEARELLHLTEDSDILELTATRIIARHPLVMTTVVRKQIQCTLGEDVASFSLNFVVSQDGLLDFFLGECKDQLDLMPNEVLRLDAVVQGGDTHVPVTTDAVFRELLMQDGELLSFIATTGDVRRVVLSLPVLCTLNGDTAEFTFKYAMDQDQLLQYLYDESKAELDLLPNDHIVIVAVVDGQTIPFKNDRELRDVLNHIPEGKPLVLMAEEVKGAAAGSPIKAAAQLTKTMKLDVTCGDASMEVTFRFHAEEAQLLTSLKNEIRGDFELNPSTDIIVMASLDGATPTALRTDDDVRDLAVRSTNPESSVQLFVSVPPTEQEAIEQKTLNRVAELNALFYDWCDMLTMPTVEASDLQLVVSNLTLDGAPLPATHPVAIKLVEMANDEVTLRVDDELLPFLTELVAPMTADSDVSRFCHGCRDVIEFMVNNSPHFRLRRSLSEAFRALAVKNAVSRSHLQAQLLRTGAVEEDGIATVFEGFGEFLSRAEYQDVMEQLFGNRPQAVSDFIGTVCKGDGAHHQVAGEGQHEVFQLRNNRLLGDIRHAFDGIAAVQLVSIALENVLSTDQTCTDLAWCVSCLLGGPQVVAEAAAWLNGRLENEVAAYNFIHACLNVKLGAVPMQILSEVALRLNESDMEPSVLLTRSSALHALVSWALAAARLACHSRRELFPPVVQHRPRPPSARQVGNDAEGSVERKVRGLSSPYVVNRFSAEAASGGAAEAVAVTSPTGVVPRFEPRLRHLSTDLQITSSEPQTMSLRELISVQRPLLLPTPPQAPRNAVAVAELHVDAEPQAQLPPPDSTESAAAEGDVAQPEAVQETPAPADNADARAVDEPSSA